MLEPHGVSLWRQLSLANLPLEDSTRILLRFTWQRLVQRGSELAVMGRTGSLVEIRLIYTIIDTGEKLVFIPSSVVMSNAIERKKKS